MGQCFPCAPWLAYNSSQTPKRLRTAFVTAFLCEEGCSYGMGESTSSRPIRSSYIIFMFSETKTPWEKSLSDLIRTFARRLASLVHTTTYTSSLPRSAYTVLLIIQTGADEFWRGSRHASGYFADGWILLGDGCLGERLTRRDGVRCVDARALGRVGGPSGIRPELRCPRWSRCSRSAQR
jgi:hypothetical protein